jgi:phenylacetate-coenzyme A ligase PaaK-like adenylate-forming protein
MKDFHEETARYWNPAAETLPEERFRALQVKKFRKIVEWAFRGAGGDGIENS